MNSTTQLTGSHLRTYQTLFQNPVSHNLGWRAIRALLEKLGQVVEEPNGNLKVTRHGHTLVLHPPRTKDVDETEELMARRHGHQQRNGPVRGVVENPSFGAGRADSDARHGLARGTRPL